MLYVFSAVMILIFLQSVHFVHSQYCEIKYCPLWIHFHRTVDKLLNASSDLACSTTVNRQLLRCGDQYGNQISQLNTALTNEYSGCCAFWTSVDCALSKIGDHCKLSTDEFDYVSARLKTYDFGCVQTIHGSLKCLTLWPIGAAILFLFVAVALGICYRYRSAYM